MASDPIEARSRDEAVPVVHVRLKVVPGASRDAVAGVIGDRLKLRVTAPPESGRANKAVTALVARTLGIARSSVRIVRGRSTPQKTIEVLALEPEEVRRLLEL